jgi:Zn-dependent peptidase ImmA (M78 family)
MKSGQPRHRNPHFENVNESPEYEAKTVLAQVNWDESLRIDLLDICDQYGFEVKFESFPAMQEEGTTKFLEEGDYHIIINTARTDNLNGFSTDQTRRRRQRFTLAHEIGHCIYKSHVNTTLQKNLQNASNPHSSNYKKLMEGQANQFAPHLLIPRQAFNKQARQIGWLDISKLVFETAEIFDVSAQVAIQQVSNLADFSCIVILFRADGTTLRTPIYSSDFLETNLYYPKSQNVPLGTLAAQMLKNVQPDQCLKKRYLDASSWFPNEKDWKTDKFAINETSIALGSYGVASFLEILSLEDD